MRKLLIAAVLSGLAVASPPGGLAYAKGHPHHAAAAQPHAAAHGHAHLAVRGVHRFAHPEFGPHPDRDWHADRAHHNRLPFIIFGVVSAMLSRQ